MSKLDFEALQAIKSKAPMKQEIENKQLNHSKQKKLLLSYPELWDQLIRKNPDSLKRNQYIRIAIREKLEKDGLL